MGNNNFTYMRFLLKVITLVSFILIYESVDTFAHSNWFRKGKYHISMVHNGSTNEDKYTNPDESELWIEIGQDTVKVVKTTKIFKFEFDDGESLDVQAIPVTTCETVISYVIDHVEETANKNGGTCEYMVLRTADGVECNLNAGVVGKGSKGSAVYGMHFTDPDFAPILWCFKDEDIEFYE
jgi:hypothetical protein